MSFRSCECQQVPLILFLLWSTPTLGSAAHPPHREEPKRIGAAPQIACWLCARYLEPLASFALLKASSQKPPLAPLHQNCAAHFVCWPLARSSLARSSASLRPSRSLPPEQIKNASIFHNSPSQNRSWAEVGPRCNSAMLLLFGNRGTKLEINFPFCSSRGGYLNLGSGL